MSNSRHEKSKHGLITARKPIPLAAEAESSQKMFAVRRQIGFRVVTCDLGNGLAHACVDRCCQEGVDVASIRSTEYRCHARDLSTLVDLVRHGCVEVGTGGKQRVEVGYHAVLVEKGMGPVEVGIPCASDNLALAVDPAGKGAKVSGQSAEACDFVGVLPKNGIVGGAVRSKDFANNLAAVVKAPGETK